MSTGPDGRTARSRPGGKSGGQSSGIGLGHVAGVPVRVGASWFLVAAVITVAFAPFAESRLGDLGAGTYAVTFAFAVLLYASVLLHEISHALAAQAFGLPVRGITLHFLGGHTEIERESPTPGRDFVISAAGPLVSLAVGAVAWSAAPAVTQDVAGFLVWQLAVANLLVGGFNLLPALPLDGGHMLRAAVWRATGDEVRATVVAARAGQVLAVLVLALPFLLTGGRPSTLGVLWTAVIAAMLWTGAVRSLQTARVRRRLPALSARRLARRAFPVAADLPVAEAVRRAGDAGASALVVVDGAGRPTGIVNGSAVDAVPPQRRPWVPVGQLARSLSPGLVLPVTLEGDALVDALRRSPGPEYLLVDGAGAVYGVLAAGDVEAALTST